MKVPDHLNVFKGSSVEVLCSVKWTRQNMKNHSWSSWVWTILFKLSRAVQKFAGQTSTRLREQQLQRKASLVQEHLLCKPHVQHTHARTHSQKKHRKPWRTCATWPSAWCLLVVPVEVRLDALWTIWAVEQFRVKVLRCALMCFNLGVFSVLGWLR